MKSEIFPYDRDGGWTIIHPFYYYSSYKALDEFMQELWKLEKLEVKLKIRYSGLEEIEVKSLIYNETGAIHDDLARLATIALLFVCMTIEAFINHYGVKRLGEDFYKRNLERTGITEKLSLISFLCCNVKLEPKDDLLIKVRNLFDQRNQLVHPKTKEFDFENPDRFSVAHPRDIDLYADFKDMEFVIDKFCEMDPAMDRSFEFKKVLQQNP
jgi:hypothetical protein